MEEITKNEIIELFNESGVNIFGKCAVKIAERIADDVIEEYNDAGDGDLQKAISYVIGDKFGMFEGV